MTWLTWRQFRAQAVAVLATLTVIALIFVITGRHLAQLSRTSEITSCATAERCASARALFLHQMKAHSVYPALFFVGIGILYIVPAVIGMFWGAPLVTRELEAGTLRLTWTQSVTRVRWLAVKLTLIGAACLATAGLLTWAVTWWSRPIDRADALAGQDEGLPNHFMPLIFGARDVTPIGYAVFAFALGVTVGVLMRRTLPAMAVTLAIVAAVQIAVPVTVRSHFVTPARMTTALSASPDAPMQLSIAGNDMTVTVPVNVPGAWVTSVETIDGAGRPFTGPAPQGCLAATTSAADCDAAINGLHLRQRVSYQPAERYWSFQWYETTLYLASALAMAGLCLWRVRHLRLS